KNDVYKQPDDPGWKSAQMHKIQIRDRLVPSDRGHAPLVPVPESSWLTIGDHPENVSGGVTTLLHRHRRNTRQRLPSLLRIVCQVTNHLDFGMPRNRKIVIDDDAADSIDRHAECFTNKRNIVTCRPNFHATRNKFVAHLQSGLSEIGGTCARAHFHAKSDKLFHRARGQILRKGSQQTRLRFDENHARLRRVDMSKILRERITRDLCDRPGHFHTSWTTANDYESHRSLASGLVRDFFRVLECH